MKLSLLLVCAVALLGSAAAVFGQSTDTNDTAFTALIASVNAKINAGKHAETDYVADLKQFDLIAAQSAAEPELAAKILQQKGVLLDEVLNEPDQTKAIFWLIKTNYAKTTVAAEMDDALQEIDLKIRVKQIRAALPPGTHLPDFSATDLAGKPQSVALHKGKVVLLDFWATWCVPCRLELPYLLDAYTKYHDQGLDIVGFSLDDDLKQLAKGIQELKIPWPQCCDGKSWQGAIPSQYGVAVLPSTLLLDQNGNVIAWDLDGKDIDAAVAKALGK